MPQTINIKNKQLYGYHIEIQNMKTSVLYMFNTSRINDFYKFNQIRISGLIKILEHLKDDWLQTEESGVVKLGEDKKPIAKEGKTYEGYVQAWDEIMDRQNQIII